MATAMRPERSVLTCASGPPPVASVFSGASVLETALKRKAASAPPGLPLTVPFFTERVERAPVGPPGDESRVGALGGKGRRRERAGREIEVRSIDAEADAGGGSVSAEEDSATGRQTWSEEASGKRAKQGGETVT